MPYYHVRISHRDPESNYVQSEYELDLSEEDAKLLGEQYQSGNVFFNSKWINAVNIKEIDIQETDSKSKSHYPTLDSSTIFYGTRIETRRVTRQFIKSEPKKVIKKDLMIETSPNNKIFIVHGRNHEPMKELKTMLYDFGLNPIVLHEKTSEGSLTLAEKLEEHSKDVGYAFIILTPDDVGCEEIEVEKMKSSLQAPFLRRPVLRTVGEIEKIFTHLKSRARQNVIFEMGYFWGLLQRKRVCCLLKGDVEKPSDINGVVYVDFKDSVKEAEGKILKKLRKAGYKIQT